MRFFRSTQIRLQDRRNEEALVLVGSNLLHVPEVRLGFSGLATLQFLTQQVLFAGWASRVL